MKAAVTVGKHDLQIKELAVPELFPEQALIKVKYTGICGTDAHIYEGTFPLLNYPLVPGHEFVGTLAGINTRSSQLKDFKTGDWVVAQPFFSCDVCDSCAQGGDNYCQDIHVMGVHVNGSMAEYAVVPAKKLIKVKDDADKRLVALTEPLAVGVHCVTKSDFQAGDTAFVIGGGTIGAMIAIAARVAGAAQVAVCDINEYRLNFVRELGFTALDSRTPDFIERLMEMTNGKGFDKVFEATGSAFGVRTMTAVAKRGGIIIQAGISTEHHPIHVRSFSDKEIQVRGVRISGSQDFKRSLEVVQSGREDAALNKIITNVFPLDNAADAFRYQVQSADHFKVVVENRQF